MCLNVIFIFSYIYQRLCVHLEFKSQWTRSEIPSGSTEEERTK